MINFIDFKEELFLDFSVVLNYIGNGILLIGLYLYNFI